MSEMLEKRQENIIYTGTADQRGEKDQPFI